jgi:IAA-amino acid hydrolase
MLLGAAGILKDREERWQGRVRLLFQPAEEGGAGAERMCREGALEDPPVRRIFGLHVWPWAPTGAIAGRSGTFLAAACSLRVRVIGRGGHAATPHLALDPVVAAAKVIVAIQTLVSRELDPLDSGVVSVASIRGGEAFNVIPPEVEMRGTIRALTLEGLRRLQARLREVAEGVARADRCRAEVEFPGNEYPPTRNDEDCWRLAREVAGEMLGPGSARELSPLMAGEDFAYYAQRVPGCMVGLGVRNEETGATHNVHHPCFKVDEDAIPIGAALHAAFALRSLRELDA